ncbi:MAG: hypothetical protein K9M49_04740 [Candidatus Marinimicrobia bacterium]|nr:hypothetical protein [Candidatus Neomarinimicrobiota bacterium]MCF7904445.1 hypothetical protein [Candidatus Neomarinimicrobiota bacterium]
MLFCKLKSISLGLIAIMMVVACDSNPTGTENTTTDYAVVRGKVDQSSAAKLAKSADGSTVAYLAEVQADGSMKLASRDSVTVNADGTFELETQATNDEYLVVVVDNGQDQKKSTVNKPPHGERPVYTKPVNDESTEESNTWMQVIAEGKTEAVTYSDIDMLIDSDVAAQIKAGNVSSADIAMQIETSNESRKQILVDDFEATTTAQLDATVTAQANAQADLDEALYSANSEAEIQAALQAQWAAYVQAYEDAGVDASMYAKAEQAAVASGEHEMSASGQANAQARFELKQRTRMRLANMLQASVAAGFEALDADTVQINSATQAGLNLQADLNAAQSTQEITAAFQTYHDSIIAGLSTSFGLESNLISSIDAGINGTTGLKATLSSSLSITTSTQAIINAYLTFYNGIRTLVETTLSAHSQAEIDATVKICILANLMVS